MRTRDAAKRWRRRGWVKERDRLRMMTGDRAPIANQHSCGKSTLLRLVAALGLPVNGMLKQPGDRIETLDEIGLGCELLHRLQRAQHTMASPGESAAALLLEGLALRLATDLHWLKTYEDHRPDWESES